MRSETDCKSRVQYRFGQKLRTIFPYSIILEEFSIPGSGGLSIDFWLPNERFAFEVQGEQHRKFSKFYHGDVMGFRAQKIRDEHKRTWCEINNIKLIAVDDSMVDVISIVDLLNDK
jgi:hypothetical protein